jgi:hypothetical protein
MKISELISKLEQLKTDHDDMDVCYIDHSDGCWCDVNEVVPSYPYKPLTWVEDSSQPACHITLK